MMRYKVKRSEYCKIHSLTGCHSCNWQGDNGREARYHSELTGHNTWHEYAISAHYDVVKTGGEDDN